MNGQDPSFKNNKIWYKMYPPLFAYCLQPVLFSRKLTLNFNAAPNYKYIYSVRIGAFYLICWTSQPKTFNHNTVTSWILWKESKRNVCCCLLNRVKRGNELLCLLCNYCNAIWNNIKCVMQLYIKWHNIKAKSNLHYSLGKYRRRQNDEIILTCVFFPRK